MYYLMALSLTLGFILRNLLLKKLMVFVARVLTFEIYRGDMSHVSRLSSFIRNFAWPPNEARRSGDEAYDKGRCSLLQVASCFALSKQKPYHG